MFDSLFWQQVFMQFHFIRPLWLLALLPLIAVVYLRWKHETVGSWQTILPKHLRKPLTIGDVGWRKQLPLKLLFVSMLLAIIVCAGPTWQRAPSPFGEDKASLLIALDNSPSMLNEDLPPSRLERSKQKVQDLLKLRGGGQTGLVVFSGTAHLAMPMTKDSSVFAPFLAAIDPSIMPIEGKKADSITVLIDEQLADDKAGTVLLISDGITPNSIAPLVDYFDNSRHQLLILASGNHQVQSSNPMDLNSLKKLANDSGGSIEVISVDDADISALNRKIERHMQLNNESAMPWQDMGYYLLIPIALLLLFWFRKGWLVQWALLLCILTPALFVNDSHASLEMHRADSTEPKVEVTQWDKLSQMWADLWLTPDQQGQWHFNQHDYLQAAIHFQDPLRKGIAYYYAGEFTLAHVQFLNADSPLSLFYAGNALARQREYLSARNLFAYLLDQDKWDLSDKLATDVKHNLKAMQAIVDEVNRLSESQAGTTDGPEDSMELGDKPQTGDGAEDQAVAAMMLKETLNANEILGSDELADKWLRKVESDPKLFLRAKFQIELLNRQSEEPSNAE
ncbi:transporter [Vibrio inusitatus NBRC 102082]|uniref:Transporter n=1 Tax=Vibrio inusitatus NBRC 102082 TaxID=1219070 RepID=A0A4Y3I070_9VIBR|nr:VWA domain-containing protein [Vibrio inusitatus]GEA52671.1 transporter [Vibrio inusitatus NBRC 102082]